MVEQIKKLTKKQFNDLIMLRRHFHMHPELGNQEFETQAFIIDYLTKLSVFDCKKIASTGVVAHIKGKKMESNRCVALRTDMDALPIQEINSCDYQSKYKDKMHACGHDAHMAIQLGVARNLASLINEFSGTVKLLFQPAEESTGGAKRMIEESCLENPYVDVVFGLHVEPMIPVGYIWYKKGPLYACADMVKIIVTGKGCHAAQPEEGIDAIVVASSIINELQKIVARIVPSNAPAVLTIGKIHGGEVLNAIANEVVMEGTMRTLDKQTRSLMMTEIEHIAKTTALAHHAQATVIITESYPVLENNDEMVDFLLENALILLGKNNVLQRPHSSMGAEDFAYFARKRPSCFYNLGIQNEKKNIIHPAHSSLFDIDEDALAIGVNLQTLLTISYLNQN